MLSMEYQESNDNVPVVDCPVFIDIKERETMKKSSNPVKRKLEEMKNSEMTIKNFLSKFFFFFVFILSLLIFWVIIILAGFSSPKNSEYTGQEGNPVDGGSQNWMKQFQRSDSIDNEVISNGITELNDSFTQKIQSELSESFLKISGKREKRSTNDENANQNETQSNAKSCQANFHQCKSILESMRSVTANAANNIQELTRILASIKGTTEELKLQEFIQCVECQIAHGTAESRGIESDDSPKKFSLPLGSSQMSGIDQKMISNQRYNFPQEKQNNWQYQQQLERGPPASQLVPPTAETIKTGQQIQMTPSLGPYPICQYSMPAAPGGQYSYPSGYGYYQLPPQPIMQNLPQGSPAYQASPYGSLPGYPYGVYPGQGLGPTGPGQMYPSGVARSGAYPCYYLPPNQAPIAPGNSGYQRNSETWQDSGTVQNLGFQNRDSGALINKPLTNEIYFAEYDECEVNEYQCHDGGACIPLQLKCDGKVDCDDASDETMCSCKDRIDNLKLCDGYFDCPLGEDELGCFGCQNNSFSCQENGRKQGVEPCIHFSARCDGVENCRNGRDEMDCSVLSESYTTTGGEEFKVGYVQGYLHRNWKGTWFPACSETMSWAQDACQSEIGNSMKNPVFRIGTIPHEVKNAPYIAQLPSGEIQLLPSCNDRAIFVTCPASPCGTRILSRLKSETLENPFEDNLVAAIAPDSTTNYPSVENGTDTVNNNSSEVVGITNGSRIIGGRASSPNAWPFIVAIYRDGFFICGGVIINENWILSAAHCLRGFQNHYFEIRAGFLRKSSFSPSAQSRKAIFITYHPNYDYKTMNNDIGLIKLDKPLRFNRFVKATCLPKFGFKEPAPGSNCIAAGWGITQEEGVTPDELMEVEIPILSKCKDVEDHNNDQICAGVLKGGKDTCQGDSGGPLMCKVPKSQLQWYTAGIVSHGKGCGRPGEAGVYTRVSKYTIWIEQIIQGNMVLQPGPKPLSVCPGFTCSGRLAKCLPSTRRCNKKVDCPNAEDEINCPKTENSSRNYEADDKKSDDAQSKNVVIEVSSDGQSTTTTESSISESTTPSISESTTPELNTTTITTELPEISTTVEITSTFKWELPEEPKYFSCKNLIQTISIDKRCNGVFDCEDGTDEYNCLCKDILNNEFPSAVCDGHIDCQDGSDEDCKFCKDDEFVCSRSRKCIPREKVCDKFSDCPFHEDEVDCISLTNGHYINMDIEGRPHLNFEGVFSEWINGSWRVRQNNSQYSGSIDDGNNLCTYIGSSGLEKIFEIPVSNLTLGEKRWSLNNDISYEYPVANFGSYGSDNNTNKGFWIKCRPTLSFTFHSHQIQGENTDDLIYTWPWEAAIFVDGKYHCPAILLDHDWLLATSRCTEKIDLEKNITTILLGLLPTFKFVHGPHQIIRKVNLIKHIKGLDASVLHLDNSVNMTRYIQPIFIEKRIFPAMNDSCVATGTDNNMNTMSIFLKSISEGCADCHRCFRNAKTGNCKKNSTNNWSGTVVCRGPKGWYPAAIFHEKDMLCGFSNTETLMSIDYINAHLTETMEYNYETLKFPKCNGIECSLGNCVSWDRVCDGIQNCRDGEDEDIKYCSEKRDLCESTDGIGCKCSKSELKCGNGKCLPKEFFCDGKVDCSDGTDEPIGCSCAQYLARTAPERLCDNKRDCFDKTDEDKSLCFCKDSSFVCGNNSDPNAVKHCIPQDYVCDGQADCENGEDEKICRTVRGTSKDPLGVGEVVHRSYGVWHSECFPAPIETNQDAFNICRTMGYVNGELLETGKVDEYGEALVPLLNDFHFIRLNNYKWIMMKENNPLVSLVAPQPVCHRAFVKCS